MTADLIPRSAVTVVTAVTAVIAVTTVIAILISTSFIVHRTPPIRTSEWPVIDFAERGGIV